nr:MAG TPA: hypothetical protein [Caudoviricetes sp.]
MCFNEKTKFSADGCYRIHMGVIFHVLLFF